MDIPWGWKDPRNTFTIDIWSKIFKNAKIIHIYRHPMDVINSLFSREDGTIEVRGTPSRTGLRKLLYSYLLPMNRLYPQSFRVLDFQGGWELWKGYIDKALRLKDQYPQLETHHISFEDFLENPGNELGKILEFCDLKADKNKVDNIINGIDTTRKYAFLSNPKLSKFYEKIKDDSVIKKLKYDSKS
jgi:hypothetical protein